MWQPDVQKVIAAPRSIVMAVRVVRLAGEESLLSQDSDKISRAHTAVIVLVSYPEMIGKIGIFNRK
jgi:hypothetical protein